MSIEATHDVTDAHATASDDELLELLVAEPQPQVLITEQEVMLGSAAALAPRPTTVTRRMINALHVVGDAVGNAMRPPPPRPHYAHRPAYLERAAMAREMDRL
jgi:hypothetical protein